jgi:hypothetical protein
MTITNACALAAGLGIKSGPLHDKLQAKFNPNGERKMMFAPTLVPAYGRDYKSKAAVLADFDAGKDFLTSGYGRDIPVDKQSLLDLHYTRCRIRYSNLRKIAVFEVKP